jgi:hypothetical protein
MRTKILALAVVLLAAPAWATVTITVTKITATKVAINYDASLGETELVRAFALDVTATDGTIVDVNNYAIGDDNAGYGIFPGNFSRHITVNPTTGEVDDWGVAGYTPVADAGDPGALGGIGTSGVTIEMGSLYDTNDPATTGVLCTVTVTAGTKKVCVTGNAIRGNIVMEDASERTIPVAACLIIDVDCFPSTAPYAIQYADWVTFLKPKCWCSAAAISTPPEDISDTGVANYTAGDFQCDGDANTDRESPVFKWRVSASDLTLVIANWKKNISAANPCADIKHDSESPVFKWRVSASDLTRLISNWKKNRTQLPGNCPRTDALR